MNIVVLGGAGLVGANVVRILSGRGHAVTAASRRTGVDVITGSGLREALSGADAVVDVVNAPSFDDEVALRFFETSTRNLLDLETALGVGHHVALSIVGAERLSANGYFRAKLAQERMVQAAGVPFTLLRATQFFEFLGAIVRASTEDGRVRLAPARIQPIAAVDVAVALAELAVERPSGATVELAGPDAFRLDDLVRTFLVATGDARQVVTDPEAPYFGTALTDETLMAGVDLRFGHTEFASWLRKWAPAHPAPTS